MKLFKRQNQPKHSLFDLDGDSVEAWVNRLPRANLSETSKQLYRALDELAKLDCGFKQRLEVLEILRPAVHLILKGLEPRYLKAPIVLPENIAKVVRLCNLFNTQLEENYRLAAKDILEHRSWAGRYKQSLALALHTQLSELGQLLLRSYLLYHSEEPDFWQRLHNCYRIAHDNKLLDLRVKDADFGSCTVEQAYLRPMLFVGAHPHQLTQTAQLKLYAALHTLSAKTKILAAEPLKCCFLFDPDGTEPPIYRELCDSPDGFLGIDTSALTHFLSDQITAGPKATTNLPTRLCEKLADAWSSISDRIEERHEETRQVDLAVGISSAHFFIAEEQTFDVFSRELGLVGSAPGQSVSRSDEDPWASAHDTRVRRERDHHELSLVDVEVIDYSSPQQKKPLRKSASYRHFLVHTINVSRSGYCIAWPAIEGNQLGNGDVLCLRESHSPCWSVGCIRWIKKQSEEELHVGIAVLSHAAEPYAAIRIDGHGPAHRALLLGAESVSGKPPCLLLPSNSFEAGAEMELAQPGGRLHVRLKKALQATRHFALYAYESIALKESEKETSTDQHQEPDEDLSEVWEIL